MANYDSNYAIAQEISARIGVSPIPFDSVYSIALEIYNELGGEPTQFDSVYSILLGILPLVEGGIASKVIDDSVITTAKTWSSSKIFSELANAGFDTEIVQSLPVSGDAHTIYFVPESSAMTSGSTDVYDEFMWVDSAWEQVGSTRIDLSDYYTVSETNDLLDDKQDKLTAGQNISIDSANTISADGYVFDETDGSLATKYLNTDEDESYIATNTASGEGAFAEGYGTTATGMGNHAEGGATQATGSQCAHAEGLMTVASGKQSHAEGTKSIASGQNSHAEGTKLSGQNPTTATGSASHAEGASTLASGNYSHAEGEITVASGASSHAEGQRTVASGLGSHAEGCWYNDSYPNELTTAAGRGSHAEGASTIASGGCAHSEGIKTTAQNESEHAEGRFNISHKASDTYGNAGNTQHSVGIGTTYNANKNATEVMQNGDMYILGVGGYQGTNTKVQDNTIKPLQTVISDINTSVAGKQDTLTAGSNISISGNTISATYEVATTAEIEALFAEPTPGQPDNEIWYTTRSGELWEPYDAYNGGDTLQIGGNTLLSNTYQNGHGVLRYANNITELVDGWGNADYEHTTDIMSITLPHSITAIGQIMNYGNSGLNTVSYNGTVAECSEIDMPYFMVYSDFDTREIVCTDGVYNIFGESEY